MQTCSQEQSHRAASLQWLVINARVHEAHDSQGAGSRRPAQPSEEQERGSSRRHCTSQREDDKQRDAADQDRPPPVDFAQWAPKERPHDVAKEED